MDTVVLGHIFAFTGIDIDTKEADVLLRPTLTRDNGVALLQTAMSRAVEARRGPAIRWRTGVQRCVGKAGTRLLRPASPGPSVPKERARLY